MLPVSFIVAVGEPDAFRLRVEAQIVGVVHAGDAAHFGVARAVENAARPVIAIRHDEQIFLREKKHAGRLLQSRDRVQTFPRGDIHDFERVIPERGEKEPVRRRVRRRVIEAPFDAGQREGLFQGFVSRRAARLPPRAVPTPADRRRES